MIVDINSEFGGIDLSLNRSLEELISSYWEAENEGVDSSDFYVLENYLSDMGAL